MVLRMAVDDSQSKHYSLKYGKDDAERRRGVVGSSLAKLRPHISAFPTQNAFHFPRIHRQPSCQL